MSAANPLLVNEELIDAIRERDFRKKKAAKSGLLSDWNIFKQTRNTVTNLKNRLKRDYYQNKIIENRKNDLWKTIKKFSLAVIKLRHFRAELPIIKGLT